MNIKSIYKILIFSIVLLISLSAVAAEESMDNTTSNDDVLTSDSHDDVLTLNSNDDILTSSEKTWYVGKNTTVGGSGTQEDPFNNIELALNHSSSNDIIYINPGVYDGLHNTNLKIDIDNLTIKAKPNSVLLNANINNTRVFEVTGNDVSISGLNFSNIYMEYGGVIKWDGNGGSLTDSTIKNSKSRVGSIRWEGNNAIINNITILNSTSENGILVISGTSSNITNSTIRDTKGYYGAVMFDGKFNIIDNCTFINNTAWMYGGGVYDWGANNTVINSLFIANNGTRGGAILNYEQQPNRMNIINNTFINNIGGQAGAIVVSRAGANIDNCTFINNSAGSAGAVLISSEANITNSIFENNSASTVGGAVYITGHGSTIDNSVFINNSARDGGAIYWSGENGTVTNTVFINNTVNNGTGEAIGYINNVTLNNVTLVNNNIEPVINETTSEYVFKLTEGYSNVKLTDNYTAYCIEKSKLSSSPRTPLIPHNDLSLLKNSKTGESVAEYLKILIYKHLKTPNGIIDLQKKIWIFTDDYYKNSTDPIIKEVISDYNSGLRILDQGFSEKINSTTVLRIDFRAYNITKQIQNMIGFKSSLENITYNMSVVKNTLTPAVILGNQTSFEIKVTNTGSYYLTNVSVIEDGYDGLIYNSFSDSSGKWIFSRNSDGKPMWTYNGTLYVGISYSFNVTFNTTKTGNFTNFVVVTSNETDNKTTNNTTKVYKPDMTVEKLSLNRTVYVGNQTIFIIVVRNTGDCDLGEVFVVEKAPEGLVYNSFKGTDWSYDGNKFTYAKVLKVNESVSFEIVFDAFSPGNWTNVVVAGSNLTGNKTGNNTTKVYNPGLKVEKITLDPVVSVGEITSFEIIVTNTGDCKLGDVFVHEDSYEGLRFHSFRGDMWKQKGDTFYYLGVLNPGESASFVILFTTLKPGNFTNIVTAGSNVTKNTTTENKTKVIENHTNNNTNGTNKTVNNETKEVNVHKVDTSRATGNPLLALLMVLLMISVTSVRKFKK